MGWQRPLPGRHAPQLNCDAMMRFATTILMMLSVRERRVMRLRWCCAPPTPLGVWCSMMRAGQLLKGRALVGRAVIGRVDGELRTVRIDAVHPSPVADVELYVLSVRDRSTGGGWRPLCEPGRDGRALGSRCRARSSMVSMPRSNSRVRRERGASAFCRVIAPGPEGGTAKASHPCMRLACGCCGRTIAVTAPRSPNRA